MHKNLKPWQVLPKELFMPLTSVGETQWQIGLQPDVRPTDPEFLFRADKIPIWVGLSTKLKLPAGNTAKDLFHSVWIHVYGGSGNFYQVGFVEGGLSRALGEPNQTMWGGFFATTRDVGNEAYYSVRTYEEFDDGKRVNARPGESYRLVAECLNDQILLSIWDQDDIVVAEKRFPEQNYILGGVINPQCSATLEAVSTFGEDAAGDLGAFEFSETLLKGDPSAGASLGVGRYVVSIQYHMPPSFYGVGRIDPDRIAVGRGLPAKAWGTL